MLKIFSLVYLILNFPNSSRANIFVFVYLFLCMGFPGSSAGKESAYNTGDPGSIPGSGRSPGEGVGYLFQYSWASLVAQSVKSLAEKQVSIWV